MIRITPILKPQPPQWEKWFAWHSVTFSDGRGNEVYAWLSVIERRFSHMHGWDITCPVYCYRLIAKEGK